MPLTRNETELDTIKDETAAAARKEKEKKRRLQRNDIGFPEDFEHVAHVEEPANRRAVRVVNWEDPDVKAFLQTAGVTTTQLKRREVIEAVALFIMTNGMDRVREEVRRLEEERSVTTAEHIGVTLHDTQTIDQPDAAYQRTLEENPRYKISTSEEEGVKTNSVQSTSLQSPVSAITQGVIAKPNRFALWLRPKEKRSQVAKTTQQHEIGISSGEEKISKVEKSKENFKQKDQKDGKNTEEKLPAKGSALRRMFIRKNTSFGNDASDVKRTRSNISENDSRVMVSSNSSIETIPKLSVVTNKQTNNVLYSSAAQQNEIEGTQSAIDDEPKAPVETRPLRSRLSRQSRLSVEFSAIERPKIRQRRKSSDSDSDSDQENNRNSYNQRRIRHRGDRLICSDGARKFQAEINRKNKKMESSSDSDEHNVRKMMKPADSNINTDDDNVFEEEDFDHASLEQKHSFLGTNQMTQSTESCNIDDFKRNKNSATNFTEIICKDKGHSQSQNLDIDSTIIRVALQNNELARTEQCFTHGVNDSYSEVPDVQEDLGSYTSSSSDGDYEILAEHDQGTINQFPSVQANHFQGYDGESTNNETQSLSSEKLVSLNFAENFVVTQNSGEIVNQNLEADSINSSINNANENILSEVQSHVDNDKEDVTVYEQQFVPVETEAEAWARMWHEEENKRYNSEVKQYKKMKMTWSHVMSELKSRLSTDLADASQSQSTKSSDSNTSFTDSVNIDPCAYGETEQVNPLVTVEPQENIIHSFQSISNENENLSLPEEATSKDLKPNDFANAKDNSHVTSEATIAHEKTAVSECQIENVSSIIPSTSLSFDTESVNSKIELNTLISPLVHDSCSDGESSSTETPDEDSESNLSSDISDDENVAKQIRKTKSASSSSDSDSPTVSQIQANIVHYRKSDTSVSLETRHAKTNSYPSSTFIESKPLTPQPPVMVKPISMDEFEENEELKCSSFENLINIDKVTFSSVKKPWQNHRGHRQIHNETKATSKPEIHADLYANVPFKPADLDHVILRETYGREISSNRRSEAESSQKRVSVERNASYHRAVEESEYHETQPQTTRRRYRSGASRTASDINRNTRVPKPILKSTLRHSLDYPMPTHRVTEL
ncbi:hypothetical protein B566_EDAN003560 [Ephemera danica]|nr:hypothetical protein B566_EDAN003560 [Ephemera danica]